VSPSFLLPSRTSRHERYPTATLNLTFLEQPKGNVPIEIQIWELRP
jgi:hypothetical protein